MQINLARHGKWSLEPHPGEVFKWIPGLEGRYDVSDMGRVRSYCTKATRGVDLLWATNPMIVLRQQTVKHNGHVVVGLRDISGKALNKYVHRLVLRAFVGDCPSGLEVRHLNGNALDNRLANIVYGTHAENMMDRNRHGYVHKYHPTRRGEHPTAKLCANDVRLIRERRAAGETYVDIAKDFNVTPAAIRFSCRGRTWAGYDLGPVETGRDLLNGEHCPWSKLTAVQVTDIRNRAADGEEHKKLAEEFGINKTSISDIVHRRTWRTVP